MLCIKLKMFHNINRNGIYVFTLALCLIKSIKLICIYTCALQVFYRRIFIIISMLYCFVIHFRVSRIGGRDSNELVHFNWFLADLCIFVYI